MDFDLNRVPFSRYGSYLAFSVLPGLPIRPQGLYLRTVHGGAAVREIARVEVIRNGLGVPYAIRTSPACLRLEAEGGLVEICFPSADQVRLRTRGVGLRLVFSRDSYDGAFPAYLHAWQVISWTCSVNLALESIKGGWQIDAPFRMVKAESMTADLLPAAGEEGSEGEIIEFGSAWSPQPNQPDFDECLRSVDKDFQGWLESTPALPAKYNEARQLAAYVNWSSVVGPSGHLKRPSMFMPKNWMTNVRSWDHCFNTLSLVYHAPEQAWDQLMVMFDCQDQQGALPDSANDARLVWSFCKQPVHGWTLLRMLERTDWITPAHLDQLYGPLRRWTNWWLRTRDYDGDGIPQYHHGNDSGWDNCTAFEAGLPLESPDLSAFLVIQMDALAEVASRLHIENEAQGWKHKSQELLHKMLAHFWRGDHFIVTQSGLHKDYWSDSLFYYLPILLGKRLPVEIQHSLVTGLKRSGLITEYGLAYRKPTQSPLRGRRILAAGQFGRLLPCLLWKVWQPWARLSWRQRSAASSAIWRLVVLWLKILTLSPGKDCATWPIPGLRASSWRWELKGFYRSPREIDQYVGSLGFAVEGFRIWGCHDIPKSGSSSQRFPKNQSVFYCIYFITVYNSVVGRGGLC